MRGSLAMRRFSTGKQFALCVVVGVGGAACSLLVYMLLILLSMSKGGCGDLWCPLLVLLPGAMLGGTVAAGRVLRRVADGSWISIKCLLATPALYLFIALAAGGVVETGPDGGMWMLGLLVLTVTYPITCLAFWIGRRKPDSNTPPKCGKCGYNLTANENGICPECGTPVEASRSSEASG